MKPEPPDLARRLALTIPEAAAVLGVSERHLRQVLPEIPHLHLGRRVVVPVEGLRDWMRSKAEAEGAALAPRDCKLREGPQAVTFGAASSAWVSTASFAATRDEWER